MKSHRKKKTTSKIPEITKEPVQENVSDDQELNNIVEDDIQRTTGIKMILTQRVQYYLSIAALASVVVVALLLFFLFISV